MAKVVVQAFGTGQPYFNSNGLVETNWQGKSDANPNQGFGGTFNWAWGTSKKDVLNSMANQVVSQFAIAFAPLTITTEDIEIYGLIFD